MEGIASQHACTTLLAVTAASDSEGGEVEREGRAGGGCVCGVQC